MKPLRQAQKDALVAMLNLNQKELLVDANSVIWKVLIYDKMGQDIISPLMKVGELREQGVTVHMQVFNNYRSLFADRQHIPDVPAVYFVQPTESNIKRIGEDFARNLYESYYINFCYAVPRALMEELASLAVSYNVVANISQVYDQYLNYISLESEMFSVNIENAYTKLNHPQTKDFEIEAVVTEMVSSLYSVLITLDVIPIIRCPKGNAAEMVASKLESKLRDHYLNTKAQQTFVARPVVVLLDRTVDLASMLSHSWTYSTMLHDALNMNLNRVTITAENGQVQKYDIDINDFFWSKNSGAPFPQVAEDVNEEINKYKQDVEKVTRSCGVQSLEEIGDNTANLKLAITAMPELTERKRILDMHMNIALNLMNLVKSRQLDVFFSMEESIQKQTKQAILDQINDKSKAQEDKLRLALIFYLNSQSKEVFVELEAALKQAGIETAALQYIKGIKHYLTLTNKTENFVQNNNNDLFGRFTSIGNKLTDHLQNAGVGTGFDAFISSVKNLLPTRNELPVTQVVDAIMEGKPEAEEYLWLDPKASKSSRTRASATFNEALVFVVGGGNYLEYQNLVDYCKNHQDRTVIYGSSDIPSPKQFLLQLNKLSSF